MDLSIVICTHNRAERLRSALEHLFAQQTNQLKTEIIVVDNNSTDDTAEVVRGVLPIASVETHYLFERAQGISYARNAGWRRARAPIVAFTDDDVEVSADWMDQIVRSFKEYPEVECVGGKVLPEWPFEPPPWLTRDHWAPLAILDYGESPLRLDHDDPRCLVGANFAFRRSALKRIGGFSAAVQRVKDGIGSIEDHEFLIRLWDAGGHAALRSRTGRRRPRRHPAHEQGLSPPVALRPRPLPRDHAERGRRTIVQRSPVRRARASLPEAVRGYGGMGVRHRSRPHRRRLRPRKRHPFLLWILSNAVARARGRQI